MRIYGERREFKMSERERLLLVFLLAGFCGLKNYKAKKKKKKRIIKLGLCFLQGPRWLRPLPRVLARESRPVNLAGTREINSWQVLLWHPGALVTELINEDTSVKIKVRKKSQLVIE